ncbi:MAG: hypothetical protein M1832_006112 [Thelocarpon impressellum]|nr:MAG: hypothetical protein M1832_006112 [Thelocarpon impressellum]
MRDYTSSLLSSEDPSVPGKGRSTSPTTNALSAIPSKPGKDYEASASYANDKHPYISTTPSAYVKDDKATSSNDGYDLPAKDQGYSSTHHGLADSTPTKDKDPLIPISYDVPAKYESTSMALPSLSDGLPGKDEISITAAAATSNTAYTQGLGYLSAVPLKDQSTSSALPTKDESLYMAKPATDTSNAVPTKDDASLSVPTAKDKVFSTPVKDKSSSPAVPAKYETLYSASTAKDEPYATPAKDQGSHYVTTAKSEPYTASATDKSPSSALPSKTQSHGGSTEDLRGYSAANAAPEPYTNPTKDESLHATAPYKDMSTSAPTKDDGSYLSPMVTDIPKPDPAKAESSGYENLHSSFATTNVPQSVKPKDQNTSPAAGSKGSPSSVLPTKDNEYGYGSVLPQRDPAASSTDYLSSHSSLLTKDHGASWTTLSKDRLTSSTMDFKDQNSRFTVPAKDRSLSDSIPTKDEITTYYIPPKDRSSTYPPDAEDQSSSDSRPTKNEGSPHPLPTKDQGSYPTSATNGTYANPVPVKDKDNSYTVPADNHITTLPSKDESPSSAGSTTHSSTSVLTTYQSSTSTVTEEKTYLVTRVKSLDLSSMRSGKEVSSVYGKHLVTAVSSPASHQSSVPLDEAGQSSPGKVIGPSSMPAKDTSYTGPAEDEKPISSVTGEPRTFSAAPGPLYKSISPITTANEPH